jgi:hypothetical protein
MSVARAVEGVEGGVDVASSSPLSRSACASDSRRWRVKSWACSGYCAGDALAQRAHLGDRVARRGARAALEQERVQRAPRRVSIAGRIGHSVSSRSRVRARGRGGSPRIYAVRGFPFSLREKSLPRT